MPQYLVATLTPFDSRGRVDLARLRAHVLWLAASGVEGFVPTGSTGEFLYLTDREREAVHRTVLDAANGRPVYPCTWDPSPHTTAYLSDAAREQGATGVLMPPPLYYNVDDDTVLSWFTYVSQSARLPVLAYHNPNYFKTKISEELYLRMRKDGMVAGIKDSSMDVYRIGRLVEQDPGAVFAGGDKVLGKARELPGIAGFISAMGNVWPKFCMRIWNGETELEAALQERVVKVRKAGGLRAMKAALNMGFRLPMLEPPAELVDQVPPRERL